MPRSNRDNLYFKDFEKLVFGTEQENQATIYHDGASIVFENVAISGTQGPAGPPGAGSPSDVLTNESGYTGIEINDMEFIDFFQAGDSRLFITDGTVVAGTGVGFKHNWGSLMVKSETEMNYQHGGLKLGFFGADGHQVIDFLRSKGSNTDYIVPVAAGDNIGIINWNTFLNDGINFDAFSRIRSTCTYADSANDIYHMTVQLETKTGDGSTWQTNLKAVGGDDPGIYLNKGTRFQGFFVSDLDRELSGLSANEAILSAAGVLNEIDNAKAEVNSKFATISGVEYWSIFDPTISGARIECSNDDAGISPEITFKLLNQDIIKIDSNAGIYIGTRNDTPRIMGVINDPNLSASLYTDDTIPTTYAVKSYVDKFALAGANTNRLLTITGDTFTINDNGFEMDFQNYDIKFKSFWNVDVLRKEGWFKSTIFNLYLDGKVMSGPKFSIGSLDVNDVFLYSQTEDFGHTKPNIDDASNTNYETLDNWPSKQWSKRVAVSQKATFTIIDEIGSSINLINNSELNTPYKNNISFSNYRGTPGAPTHCFGGEKLGTISWDYAAQDGNPVLDRAAWIEARTGYVNAYEDNKWEMYGGILWPRTDWHKIENELLLAASPYIHYGRVRIRSKLYFDDGTNNFVSGIIQSTDSPLTVGNIENNPWNTTASKRRIWGLDHALPTAQWVLDQVANREATDLEDYLYPSFISTVNRSGYGYGGSNDHLASISPSGFWVKTGYSPGSMIFSVNGSQGNTPSSLGAFTWAARLVNNDYSTRFFIENYRPTGTTSGGTPYTGELCFYRSRGGNGMLNHVKTETYDKSVLQDAFDSNYSPANNNAVIVGDIIGRICAYGHAPGNGIDRDPCTHWEAFSPGAILEFKAANIAFNFVDTDFQIKTTHTSTSSIYPTAIFDWKGCVHMGYSTRNYLMGMTPLNSDLFAQHNVSRRKAAVNIVGSGYWPNSTQTLMQSSLSVWCRWPSITFSTEALELDTHNLYYERDPNHFSSRIIHVRDGDYWRGYTDEGANAGYAQSSAEVASWPGGLSFWIWDKTTKREREAMLITNDRNIIVGDYFHDQTKGIFSIFQRNNVQSGGLAIVSATSDKSCRIYMDSNEKVVISTNDANDIYISPHDGPVRIGNVDGTHPAEWTGKLIVNGNITPAIDNKWSLGVAAYRWDNIWATNGTIQVSDKREKNTIKKETLGLDFIKALKPCSFKRTDGNRTHHGLIAQEVETLIKSLGKSTKQFAGIIYDEKSDKYGLRYEEFIAPIIKAIQELAEAMGEK